MRSFASLSVLLWLTALVLVIFTFSKLPLTQIGASIAALTWAQWLSWILINLLIIFVGNRRWFLLNKAVGFRVKFLQLLAIRQAGQTVSFITPGPQFGGEPLQIFWLCRYQKIQTTKAVTALAMDRFCELLVNFSVLLSGVILLAFFPSTDTVDWIRVIVALTLLVGSVLGLGWTFANQPRWASIIFVCMTARWQHSPRLQRFGTHWRVVRNNLKSMPMTGSNGLGTALLLSALGWIGIICELWMLLEFLDLEVTLQALVLILVAMRLAMLLPIPGGIGSIEAAVLWSFSTLVFTPGAALGLIALMRTRDFVVLFGGLCAWLTIRSSHSLKTAPDTPPNR